MTEIGKVEGLSWRQRRDMGLTLRGVMGATRRLADSGQINSSTDHEELVELIATELALENPKAWAEAPAIDWAKVIEWIEMFLPVILAFLALL